MGLTRNEQLADHLANGHGATLHPPGKPDGISIASTDEDMDPIHSIYYPNCDA